MKPLAVFLVDDNPRFLQIAGSYLASSHPAEVAVVGTAATAEEACELVTRLIPDAVVADLALPGHSGLDLIGWLRARRADVVLVALTVHDDESHRRAALVSGADAYVCKANLATDLVPALIRAARSHDVQPREGR